MKAARAMALALLGLVLAGCATHVSQSKRRQVELATQTGPYAYLRTAGPGPGAR